MTGEMDWSDIGPNRFARRGRLLTVAGTRWRWRVGRGGNVIAYSEYGERRLAGAWTILGITPDEFERGQWKITFSGMVRPADVAKWISSHPAAAGNQQPGSN